MTTVRKRYVRPARLIIERRLLPLWDRDGLEDALGRAARHVGVTMRASTLLKALLQLEDVVREKRERCRLASEPYWRPWPLEELAKTLADPAYVPLRPAPLSRIKVIPSGGDPFEGLSVGSAADEVTIEPWDPRGGR